MKLECERCGHEWEYVGEGELVTKCPECLYEVKVPAKAEVIAPEYEIDWILDKYEKKPRYLIPILQEVQEELGYLPEPAMIRISEYLGIPESKLFGVATFYAQFRFEPLGEHLIKVCHGTACHVKGADNIHDVLEDQLGISTGETTGDGKFTLERVACLGCCSLAPVIMVDDKAHGNLDRDKLKEILADYRGEN